jgi:hypothetical protein
MNKYKGVIMIARTFKAFSGRTGSVYPIESSGFQGQLENKQIPPLWSLEWCSRWMSTSMWGEKC